jgi:radical SAM superfamily enzyme YgiQ (UPF0313 family)
MLIRLVFPAWERLAPQTRFILPPLGVALVAALTPREHEVLICDENLAPVDLSVDADLVGISVLLAAQLPRALAIADAFRSRGIPVILGGLSAGFDPGLVRSHVDALVLGEAEGIWKQVIQDAARGCLKPVYRGRAAKPASIPLPRRDLLKPELYNYRGVRMMELVETCRGCRKGCFVCAVPRLYGRRFRPRTMSEAGRELAAIGSERIYLVDASLEQSEAHQRRLFPVLGAAKKAWVSHPISMRPDLLDLAARCGCWYIYQGVAAPSKALADKVRLLHEHGIGVEAAVLLGDDSQGPDIFPRLLEFLIKTEIDIADFTMLVPVPGSDTYDRFKSEGRLLHEEWGRYNGAHAVFRPARMTPEQLEAGYHFLWREYYREKSQPARMFALFRRLEGRAGALRPAAA